MVAAVGTTPRLVETKKEMGTSFLNEISTDQLGNRRGGGVTPPPHPFLQTGLWTSI